MPEIFDKWPGTKASVLSSAAVENIHIIKRLEDMDDKRPGQPGLFPFTETGRVKINDENSGRSYRS